MSDEESELEIKNEFAPGQTIVVRSKEYLVVLDKIEQEVNFKDSVFFDKIPSLDAFFTYEKDQIDFKDTGSKNSKNSPDSKEKTIECIGFWHTILLNIDLDFTKDFNYKLTAKEQVYWLIFKAEDKHLKASVDAGYTEIKEYEDLDIDSILNKPILRSIKSKVATDKVFFFKKIVLIGATVFLAVLSIIVVEYPNFAKSEKLVKIKNEIQEKNISLIKYRAMQKQKQKKAMTDVHSTDSSLLKLIFEISHGVKDIVNGKYIHTKKTISFTSSKDNEDFIRFTVAKYHTDEEPIKLMIKSNFINNNIEVLIIKTS